jgi:hypothetical protein
MINKWKLKSANIIIPILSNITNHKSFKNLKITETLKDGIKNVRKKKRKFQFRIFKHR